MHFVLRIAYYTVEATIGLVINRRMAEPLQES